ncbi:hypothetical protein VFPPC_16157 [Pochonia chlamydosporia 170]|uniref:Uncharacterized protein n=1 Tax=Pochonia chlamydosporia 170 TaxID=1380566 RepID=A0A179FES6_METCM|nr:hypothetical protein VFPPC_16157 [Pochonia chlamydosporia 170]OAQ64095.1 hypothetical protein VFPPC_16157 [Pochonia chlamydosporia 170]
MRHKSVVEGWFNRSGATHTFTGPDLAASYDLVSNQRGPVSRRKLVALLACHYLHANGTNIVVFFSACSTQHDWGVYAARDLGSIAPRCRDG